MPSSHLVWTTVTPSLTRFTKHNLSRLQLIQNAAATLLAQSNTTVNITPILASLRWLPVCFRIGLRILMITLRPGWDRFPSTSMNV